MPIEASPTPDPLDSGAIRAACPEPLPRFGPDRSTQIGTDRGNSARSTDHDLSTIAAADPSRTPNPAHALTTDALPIATGFETLRLLGKGAFASVYLARQYGLDRLVALKVSADAGGEARTMASLEHANIVQVFSETVDPATGLRLLCMQYVAGPTLEQVVAHRVDGQALPRCGRLLLQAIDALSTLPDTFDPSSLRDREALDRADGVEAVCWIGERLAEALAYAHGRGVLHRDLKPANILVNQYGRPLLADFNLSLDPRDAVIGDSSRFGGTLAYMSPEHIDAFNPDDPTPHSAVDERSDVYSLGMVLFELASGHRPFGSPRATTSGIGTLREMSARRRHEPPSARAISPGVPESLDRLLRRCLDPDPARRFTTAADLARALEGCREARRLQRELPAEGRFVRSATRRPIVWLVLLLFLPHVLGSVVNIAYNAVEIVSQLTEPQQRAFAHLLLAYNLLVYPACLWAFVRLIRPTLAAWRALETGHPIPDSEIDDARRGALSWPRWAIVLSLVGWIPGSVLFPLGIHLKAGPLNATVFEHFLISFWTSGLIALTYSYFGVQFLALRVFYPVLWSNSCGPRIVAGRELRGREGSLHRFQFLAGLIPLVAAALLVGLGPQATHSLSFRLLTTSLILAGMVGFGLAILVTSQLVQTVHRLTGAGTSAEP